MTTKEIKDKKTPTKAKKAVSSSKKPKSKAASRANVFNGIKKNYRNLNYSPRKVNILFRIFIITIAALLVTFSLDAFVHPAGLYSGGLRGIQQIIIYAVPYVHQHIWISYLIFFGINVPLAYFGFKYIGRRFTLLTLYFILIQTLFSYLFAIDGGLLHNFHIFNYSYMKDAAGHPILEHGSKVMTESAKNFKYLGGIIGGIIYGVGIALTFVAGASSGGSKFVVAYLAKKKNWSLGKVGLYIAIIIVTTGIIINLMIVDGKSFAAAFISTNLFASALYIIVQNMVINRVAPRTVRTQIHIEAHDSEIKKLKTVISQTIMSKRSWHTSKIKVGDLSIPSSITSIIVDKRETQYIVRKLYKACPDAVISWHDVKIRASQFTTRDFD